MVTATASGPMSASPIFSPPADTDIQVDVRASSVRVSRSVRGAISGITSVA